MNILIVYDPASDSTAQLTQAIKQGLGNQVQTIALDVSQATRDDLKEKDVLIIGWPTHGGKATKSIKQFIKQLPNLKGMKAAIFDTRQAANQQSIAARTRIKVFGDPFMNITKALKKKGGHLIIKPEDFTVTAKEGPLKDGELTRADEWALAILHNI